MLTINNVSLKFGKRTLFENVNIKFTKGNCYGVIGANGSGKSSFLKLICGNQYFNEGDVILEPGCRISFLKQYHHDFDKFSVLETVIMGNKNLYDIKSKINYIYSKSNFSEQDSIEVGNLTSIYDQMDGWNSENLASLLLSNLGVIEKKHYLLMSNIETKIKVRVLLAQALFGNPGILVLDEPTNGLDLKTINWLKDFICNYENIVIVVSHDRYFLDSICSHICDIDFQKITTFTGNYSFWYKSVKLINKFNINKNKKIENKRKSLESFINRFGSNASKSKQATSRKKILENIKTNDFVKSSRRYPAIKFIQNKEAGNQILEIENISKVFNKELLFKNLSITLKKGDRLAVISNDIRSINFFYEIIMNKIKLDSGFVKWGVTVNKLYISSYDNLHYFDNNLNIIDWLKQYVVNNDDSNEEYIRGLLGRMLFSGDDALKKNYMLSGGERMRCLFSLIMLIKPNVILLNEPTAHLDIETITSLNNALKEYKGTIIFTSQDHQLLKSIANRILEINSFRCIDKYISYDDYINDL